MQWAEKINAENSLDADARMNYFCDIKLSVNKNKTYGYYENETNSDDDGGADLRDGDARSDLLRI